MVVSAIGIGLAYITHVLLAQWLGVEPYGHYIYALAWLNVLVTLVQMGMNTSTVRLTAEFRAKNDLTAVMGLLRFSTLLVLGAGTAVILLGGGVLVVLDAWGILPAMQSQTLAFMLPLIVILALLNQRMAILQGYERVAQAQAFLEIVRPVVLLVVLGILLSITGVDAHIAMAANILATFAALVAVTFIVSRLMTREKKGQVVQGELQTKAWLKVSLPYLAIGGLTVVMDQSDVLILGSLVGGAVVGLYLPALKLSQLLLFPMLAIRSHAAPLFAKLHAENKMGELQHQLNTTTISSAFVGLVLMIAIVWQREFLLSLFGVEFVEAAPAMVILTLGMLVFAFTGGVEVFLIIGPFERLTVKIYILVVIVNISLNFLLIPPFGLMGAAYATAISIALRGFISVYAVWRKTGMLPWCPASKIDMSLGGGA